MLSAAAILNEYPDKVKQYLAGRDRLMGLFVGELMKRTKGAADPKQAPEIFKRLMQDSA